MIDLSSHWVGRVARPERAPSKQPKKFPLLQLQPLDMMMMVVVLMMMMVVVVVMVMMMMVVVKNYWGSVSPSSDCLPHCSLEVFFRISLLVIKVFEFW